MSCNCNCGCDNKYSGGVQCYPLIIEISHPLNISYTCQAFNAYHPSSPKVSFSSSDNCSEVDSEEKDTGRRMTLKYVFALYAKSASGCSGGNSSEKATVKFSVSPPERGWHNKGDGEDEAPFTKYDSSNPECSVKCKARMRSESDSGEYYFESTSNPNPSDHLGRPESLERTLVVEVSGGKISVEFRRA